MTMPKKSSRAIEVDGVAYRWTVNPDSDYMVLIVEAAEEHGQVLEAYYEYDDVQGPDGHDVQLRRLTPADAAEVIREGLAGGWQPTRRGIPPMQLRKDR